MSAVARLADLEQTVSDEASVQTVEMVATVLVDGAAGIVKDCRWTEILAVDELEAGVDEAELVGGAVGRRSSSHHLVRNQNIQFPHSM